MRVSSATALLDAHQPASHARHVFGASQASIWSHLKHYFHKLDRFMTAVAHAEAGNLDAVQKILDEDTPVKNSQRRSTGNGRMEWQ